MMPGAPEPSMYRDDKSSTYSIRQNLSKQYTDLSRSYLAGEGSGASELSSPRFAPAWRVLQPQVF